MTYNDRASDIRSLLWQHAHPTLRNMDHDRIAKLAEQILRVATDRGLWAKWSPDREEIAERAANLWIPLEDLKEALNTLPGPPLTKVDVEQRVRDFREKQYGSYPKSEMEADALAAFVEEKARGTEFIAVLGHMEEWYWGAEERLRQKREKDRREQIAEEKKSPRRGCATVRAALGPRQSALSTSIAVKTVGFIGSKPFRQTTSSSQRLKSCELTTSMLNGAVRSAATASEAMLARRSPTSPGRNTTFNVPATSPLVSERSQD